MILQDDRLVRSQSFSDQFTLFAIDDDASEAFEQSNVFPKEAGILSRPVASPEEY
jgi:hypothetical protein